MTPWEARVIGPAYTGSRPLALTIRLGVFMNSISRGLTWGLSGAAVIVAISLLTPNTSSQPENSNGQVQQASSDPDTSANQSSGDVDAVSPETTQPLPPDTPQDAASPHAPSGSETARDVLGQLDIKGRAPQTGYDREGQFGPTWFDVDANGCDTRNDILRRDLDDTVVDSSCRVLSGVLTDPFSGDTIDFERGETTSILVQVDHVVALSNAWQTGAQQLTPQQRLEFANDPLNLIAVSGRLNAQKGDGDAATWLPPRRDYWCEYVARQVSVKAQYDLWVTQAEFDRIDAILAQCPSFPALTTTEHGGLRPGNLWLD